MEAKNCNNCLNVLQPDYGIFTTCKRVSRATKYKPRKNQITEEQFDDYMVKSCPNLVTFKQKDNGCPFWVSDSEVK